jgi:hypothetical protein
MPFDDKGTGVWIRHAYAKKDAKGVCNMDWELR